MALTALEIKHAKAGMHADGNGLYLRVQASGAKGWIFRFQLDGKRREMGIGTLAERPAVDARAAAAELGRMVREGLDPIEERNRREQEANDAAKQAEAGTVLFRQVAADYIASHRAGWRNAKHADQWANTLATYADPVIGDLAPAAVTAEHLLAILSPIWTTKPETASRVRSRIELVLSYAKAKKLRDGENPAMWRGHLDALLPKPSRVKKVRHHPALPYAQMSEFMLALRNVQGLGARALEFAILNAARSGEVRLAEWREIDLDAATWTVPADRMKARRAHRVPLSQAALRLLKSLPRLDGTELLFPGMREQRPMSDMALTSVIRRMNEDQLKWMDPKSNAQAVPHGFRSTFRDWCAEQTHFPAEMAEIALAHTVGDKVEAAYRRGDMFEKRRAMMQAWADWCLQEPQEESRS
ncbi:MAG: integrase arm-type DNA-binding domain-containing protein [Rhodocyclaceae bacterium]|nr:integrase arm-type DNA-binding domain-containing protein [Rhodocyclaceae bacterium]